MSSWKANSALAILIGPLLVSGQEKPPGRKPAENVATLVGKTDFSCILRTWRLKGVRVCVHDGVPVTCLWVENAYPCGILELVRQPGRTEMAEAVPFTRGLEELRAFGKTSSHTTASESGTELQFSEARVYTFVPPIGLDGLGVPIAKPQGPLFRPNYVTELDGFGWRTGLADFLSDPVAFVKNAALPSCSALPTVDRCAGRWGSYAPRIGFISHPSEVLTAYLLGLRAGRVAATPTGRAILAPYPFEPRTGHYVQMVRPSLRSCGSIGAFDTLSLEANALSKDGSYLFIHFGIFEECKGCLPLRLMPPRAPGVK